VWRFLAGRACLLVVLVLAASSAMVLVTNLAPGDVTAESTLGGASAETTARERARLGLDRPASARFVAWLGHAVRLDFGTSFRYGQPVSTLVATRAARSALLAGLALLLAVALALPLGVLSGSGRFPRLAGAVGAASLLLFSLPPLLLALLLTVVAARTGWAPAGGMQSAGADEWPLLARLLDLAHHLVVPVLALGLPLAASLERVQHGAVAEGVSARHVMAASARGVGLVRWLWRALWRPTAAPVASVLGLAAGTLLSGSLAVELVTAWPGLGRLMFEALATRDTPLAAGCGAAAAAFLACWTTLGDVLAWWLDPRLRPGAEA
jgi:ABC-type dipeptide/oligopeptide/nickel transport system permease component